MYLLLSLNFTYVTVCLLTLTDYSVFDTHMCLASGSSGTCMMHALLHFVVQSAVETQLRLNLLDDFSSGVPLRNAL